MPAASEAAARRYADAVFDLAQEENRLDDWEQQLVRLSDLFSGVGVTTWLANPSIPMTDKEALIDTGLADVGAEVRNLGRLLVTRGRADLAVQILSIYKERLDRARGIVHARVTTAVPLSAEEEAAVRERLLRMTGQQ
ncbi:MAG: ATP synthase F1 subunit delta, partial [Dehalococcoidia bacterium]